MARLVVMGIREVDLGLAGHPKRQARCSPWPRHLAGNQSRLLRHYGWGSLEVLTPTTLNGSTSFLSCRLTFRPSFC